MPNFEIDLPEYPSCKDCEHLENNTRKELELPLVDGETDGCTLNSKGLIEDCPKNKWKRDFKASLLKKKEEQKALLFYTRYEKGYDDGVIETLEAILKVFEKKETTPE